MAMRASRALLNETKYASSHKYTYVEGRTPFWRKFREMFSMNPEISSGLPRPQDNRSPAPGSRKEMAATQPSRASDIAGNLYYNRDFRRKYPRLEAVTQAQLTQLLLAAPNEDGTRTLADPDAQGEAGNTSTTALTRPKDINAPEAFTQVLAQVHSPANAAMHYSETNLPPRPPFRPAHHILKKNPGAVPTAKHAYYPAENYV